MDGGKIYFLQTAETDIGEASSEEDGDSSPANSAHVTVDGQENQEAANLSPLLGVAPSSPALSPSPIHAPAAAPAHALAGRQTAVNGVM